jgi:hypothetical protein
MSCPSHFTSQGKSLLVPTVCWSESCGWYSDLLWTGQFGVQTIMGVKFSALIQTGPCAYPASYTMGKAVGMWW